MKPRALPRHRTAAQRGFTLVEVLIAVLIFSIALLGLGGIEALSMVNTQVARTRSIVALQANSLAATMQGNRTFWSNGVAPTTFSIAGGTIRDPSGLLTTTGGNCLFATAPSSGQCTPQQIAVFDVQNWANTMNLLVPTHNASVACSNIATNLFTCTLTITWTERFATRGTTAEADSSATGGLRSYTLYIAP